MAHDYGQCYYCHGAVTEKIMDVDYRWKGQLYIIEQVPAGVCIQCGERYFTAEVEQSIDKVIQSKEIKRLENIPVKEFTFA